MRYSEIQPKPPLANFIECFWTLEDDKGVAAPEPERILPDGCVELVLNFGAPFKEQKEDGIQVRQPMHFLVGQMTRPMFIVPTGAVQTLGIRFHPGGTRPFFRIPMQELTNQVVELAALSAELERELIARCDQAQSLLKRISVIEGLLVERVRDYKDGSRLVGLTAEIINRGGQCAVDALATAAGLSSRQLERRFLYEVGIGPKLLCRILRFQQIFRAVDADDASWAAVAADCGYYDQAHLIRDFQQFSRQTPAALFQRSSALTESFTRKNRTSDFSNTPA